MTCSLTLMVTFAGLKSKSSMSTFALAANPDGATRIVTRVKIKARANNLASLADFILELSFITIHVCGESQARSSAGQGFSSRKKGRPCNDKVRMRGSNDYAVRYCLSRC